MDKLRQAKEIFDKFDVNGDGHIGALELKACLAALGLHPPNDVIAAIVSELIIIKSTIFYLNFLVLDS